MKTLFSLTCVLTVLACSQASANLIFDDFDEPVSPGQFSSSGFSSGPAPFTATGFGVTGTRTLAATVSGQVMVNANATPGLLAFSNFSTGGFSVLWDTFSAPLDLSSMTSFLLTDVSWTGVGSLDLQLVLNSETSATVSVAGGTSGGSVEFFIPAFTSTTLNNITSVQLQTASDAGAGAFSAESLVVTPEPSGLILAGLGLASLCTASYVRRRKQPEVTTTAA